MSDTQAGSASVRVFLSYGHADRADAARLAAALEASGVDVWWDHLIEGGAAFARRIESALENANAVVVLWSERSVQSDWVLDEAARGRDLRKLVPASIDGTAAPLGFRQYQTIDLRGWRAGRDDDSISRLLRAVSAAGRSEVGLPIQPPAPPLKDRSRRRLIVGGLAAVPLLAGTWFVTRHRLGPAAGNVDTSVAVLPFENLGGVADEDYFSDGLSEEVRSTLARNLALKVMAKSSSGRFRSRDQDAVEIARELGVSFLLDGSVRRSGDTVRVSANLVDGRTGFDRWSEVFERRLTDVFAVQTEIAFAVADALGATLGEEAGTRASLGAIGGTRIPAALDAYLRGRSLYDLSADEASERAALAQFDRAVALDPAFAAAHAARARSLTAIANQYGAPDALAGFYDEAVSAAERAIALAPDLAEAHSTLGFILFQGRLDARAARAPFDRSMELGAGEATVLARFALFAARTGRHDAAQEALTSSLARDPLNPLIHRAAGNIAYAARRFGDALAPLEKSLTMNPKLSRAHAAIGDARLNLGDVEGALASYSREPVADMRLTGLAIAHERAERHDQARAALETLVADLGDRVLYQQAQVQTQFGAFDVVFDRLTRARQLGDSGLIYARNDPFLDPLRADARFDRLLESLGFDIPAYPG
jgi:TolB-like protein/Flp pilus assembly protein TadD